MITSVLSQIGTPRELSLILLREPDECGAARGDVLGCPITRSPRPHSRLSWRQTIQIGCLRRFPSSEYSERPGSMAAASDGSDHPVVERFARGSRLRGSRPITTDLTMVVPASKLSIRYPPQELCVTGRKSIWCRNRRRSALAAVRRPSRTTFPADRTRRFSR